MNLGNLLKVIKPFANNGSRSDEDMLNNILEGIVKAEKVTMNNSDDLLYFNKSYTSKIKTNAVSIPPLLVKAANRQRETKTGLKMFSSQFYNKYISTQSDALRQELESLINNDEYISLSDKNYLLSCNDSCEFLFQVILFSLSVENKTITNTSLYIWKSGNSYIKLIQGDLFRYAFSDRRKRKTIVVVPVNTRFDTHLSTKMEKVINPMISSETVHGEWILRLKKRSESMVDIQNRIIDDLSFHNYACNSKGEYPIGTIASIELGNTCFYLLAISTFDKDNRARSDKKQIINAINSLFEYYDINGQGYEIYIPLIGTGRSRSGISVQEAFEILNEGISKRKSAFHGKVNIVVTPEAFNELKQGGKF